MSGRAFFVRRQRQRHWYRCSSDGGQARQQLTTADVQDACRSVLISLGAKRRTDGTKYPENDSCHDRARHGRHVQGEPSQ